MIDIIAATAVLVASLLALVGAVGLIRLPDVFTRLHAAAKSATLAVVLTTLAAALEVDTFGAVALLLLVAVLLFLSAPLGSSLLARAAYHDAETPRVLAGRDDLAAIDVTAGLHGAPDRRGAAGLLVGWLAIVWIGLFASGTPGVLVGALLVGLVVSLMLPGYRPRWPEGVFKPLAFARFLGATAWIIVVANVDVAAAIIRRRPIRPAVVRVPLIVRTRTEIALLMNVTTFTPGTVAVELHGSDLFVHVMDLRDEAEFRASFSRLEALIIAAFGTADERSTSDR